MTSIGSVPAASVGQVTPGPWSEAATHNGDPGVTHVRGRIDDLVRHLGMVRTRVTPENTSEVSGPLDDADRAVESALDLLLSEDGLT